MIWCQWWSHIRRLKISLETEGSRAQHAGFPLVWCCQTGKSIKGSGPGGYLYLAEELSQIKEEVVKVVHGDCVSPRNPPHEVTVRHRCTRSLVCACKSQNTHTHTHTSSALSDGLSLAHGGQHSDSEQYAHLLCVQRSTARFPFYLQQPPVSALMICWEAVHTLDVYYIPGHNRQ